MKYPNPKHVAAASLATVALLGINSRIDNDRVYRQAKVAETAPATEDLIPYAPEAFAHNNPPVGYWAYMTAVVHFYPCQEDDECWDCESMGNRVCGDKTENGGNR